MKRPDPSVAGLAIRRASWWGTGVFAATAVGAVVAPGALEVPAFAVAVALFAAGCVAFLAAYGRAVRRSRQDAVGLMDLYLLSRIAPASVRHSMLGSLAAQVVVALATAAARPYTSLAAGILVPTYGLGLCGLWGARHGRFPRRSRPSGRR